MDKSGWRIGPIVALIVAVVLMAGAIVYAVHRSDNAAQAGAGTDTEAAQGPGGMSTPPSFDELRARAEASPDNATLWEQLGYAYFEHGQFDKAAAAYRKATSADPGKAVLWSSLGEAIVMASTKGDPIPPEARNAFARAYKLDPNDPRTRYFLAVEQDLAGHHQQAITQWLALLADTPRGAPWEADLIRTIRQVGKINKIPVAKRIETASASQPAAQPDSANPALAGIPGPTKEDLAAASGIPPSQQEKMVEGMVARLATRLKSQPNDVNGWIMLMRSYKTLGKDAKARDALSQALAANPGSADQLHSAASALGI